MDVISSILDALKKLTTRVNRLETLENTHAASAINADTVDLIHASATPTANQLLPLNASVNFDIGEHWFYGGRIELEADAVYVGANIYAHDAVKVSFLSLYRSRGTKALPTAVQAADVLGLLTWGGYDSAGYYDRALIKCIATTTWTVANHETKLEFYTTPNGAIAEALAATIFGNGDLTITGELTTKNVYNDLYVPLAGAKVPAANYPAWTAYSTNLASYTFALNDYADLATAEVLHDYAEGTNISIHVHFVTNGANDATERKVKYTVYYSWGDVAEAMSAEGSLTAEETIPALEADRMHHNLLLGTITGTNYKIGSIVKLRIKRIAGTGTEPANDPFVEMVGIHYQLDALGSAAPTTK